MTQTETEPYGVADVVTPSGLEIHYEAGPKRLYRIRDRRENLMTGEWPNWVEVPSVSTVLGVLDKPALVWWAMKVGVEGICALWDEERLGVEYALESFGGPGRVDAFVDLLKQKKLTVNHQRDKAADRGTNVHSALEAWAETGVTPDPRFFPENERGYVQGLVNFINDAHPHPLHSEFMVASLDGWAGRGDLVANLDFAGKVVVKTYPKREPIRANVSGTWGLDLKTSKSVYETYHIQLGGAYRHGYEECGYGRWDHAGVLRLTDDGRYELVECKATYDDFLNVLQTYNSIQRIKGK